MALWGDTREKAAFRVGLARKRTRRWRVMRTLILLFVCGGLLAVVWNGTRAESLTISAISVTGDFTIDVSMVEREAESELDGSYFLIVPRRFSPTYPHDAITAAVERLPRVASAAVARASSVALSIALVEYIPYALWCSPQDTNKDVGADCLYISDTGFAFDEAPSLVGAVFPRYITPGRASAVGTFLADTTYVQATKEFSDALRARHGLRVYAITETNDKDVQYLIQDGGALLVSRDADIQEVSENIDAVLSSAEFIHLRSGDFVYIDLRFGNKVFVKEFESASRIEASAGAPAPSAATEAME